MQSIILILVLNFDLARSAAVPVFPKAEVNAPAITTTSSAESLATSKCPTGYTTTTTITESGSGTVFKWATATAPTSTRIVTDFDYFTTSYSSAGPTETWVEWSYTGTTTGTFEDSTTVGTCTSFTTITNESTSTFYTGFYTPTALPNYCPTGLVREFRYLGGEATITAGTVTITPSVTSTTYEPATRTIAYYDTTTTITSTGEDYTWVIETSTTTMPYSTACTSTLYTATASTAATQSAKCAPTNLIPGISSVGNAGRLMNNSTVGAAANKDASSCCQACVDNDECVAMDFMSGAGNSSCALWLGSDCGKSSIQVQFDSDISNWTVQAGCGSIVYPEGWL